jgi:Putative sterol carrier protein
MASYEVMSEIIGKASAMDSFKKEIAGFNKTFLFKPSDAKPYHVEINNGTAKLAEGEVASPSATISATDQVLSDIFTGKTDAIKAFMQGQLKVSGDIFSAQKLTGIVSKLRK